MTLNRFPFFLSISIVQINPEPFRISILINGKIQIMNRFRKSIHLIVLICNNNNSRFVRLNSILSEEIYLFELTKQIDGAKDSYRMNGWKFFILMKSHMQIRYAICDMRVSLKFIFPHFHFHFHFNGFGAHMCGMWVVSIWRNIKRRIKTVDRHSTMFK